MQFGNRHAKDGIDHHQQEEDDDHEQGSGPGADDIAGQRADRFRLVSHTGPDGAEIVDTREEHRADHDPQESWQPPPDDGDAGTDDWRRAGDRREVVAPENDPIRRHVVDVVTLSVRRCLKIRVELIDFLGDEF